jgi:hypothetical protein
MINYIHNFFGKNNKKPTVPVSQQLLALQLGSYVVLELNKDICEQHLTKGIDRFDKRVLETSQLKGLVRHVHNAGEARGYLELVGLVVAGEVASRREYVVMFSEITKLTVVAN